MRVSTFRFAIVSALILTAGAAQAQTVEIARGRTSVLLDVDLLTSVGLDLSSVSGDVEAPGSLGAASVAFPINRRDAESPLLPTDFSYDASDFFNTFAGTIEHVGSVFFNTDTLEVGNFTIGFDAARIDAITGASGFFVESTVGTLAPIFDIALVSATPGATSLVIEADLLVSAELAGVLMDAGLEGVDVGDAIVEAAPDVAIGGGQTSVALDTTTLSSVGLDLTGTSMDVIVPGSLPDSVAFAINARDAVSLPTTFTFAPEDFLATFAGTIEHLGSVFFDFDSDPIEVGNFTIGFDETRIDAGTGATGFFVASTVGIVAPIFDVKSAGLEVDPRETGLTISGELGVSPELDGAIGSPGVVGVTVGEFVVHGFAPVTIPVEAGQTNVALDTATLSSVGLDLSSISMDVIAPGALPDSVAFGINARDAMAPALATTFEYDPTDFLGSFSGTIEHTGSVFFNLDALEVGNFTIGFDAARIDGTTDASGFFVTSQTGLTAPLFDVASTGLVVDATDTTLEIAGDLLVSEELAGVLMDAGLEGVDVGDFLVQAVPEPAASTAGAIALATLALVRAGRRRRADPATR